MTPAARESEARKNEFESDVPNSNACRASRRLGNVESRSRQARRASIERRLEIREIGRKGLQNGSAYLQDRFKPRARNGGATKWPQRDLNLPLAASPRVGHIGRNGAVAEWLKAAVC